MTELNGKRVAFLATDMVEQAELTEPWKAVEERGAMPELLSIEEGEIQGFDHYEKAETFPVDRVVGEARADDYDALVLPGGVGNPDTLRTDEDAVRFVREFVESGKPVAVICHGPWTLVEADVVRGRTLTSYPSIRTDIRNAGGEWVDHEVVVDRNLISSRRPDDLPAFNSKLVEALAAAPVHAEVPAALLDVDGTLVDTNYHHALAWWRAFRAHGITLPLWRIHRHVGMGGDQLVPALVPRIDADLQEAVEETRREEYGLLIGEVVALDGAHELIVQLKERGVTVVLASSSPLEELDRYLELLDARDLADAWTTKDDVDATKPAPDLVVAALEKAGGGDAVMVGDTPWDVEAARKAGVATICLITGGFSGQELRDAGAAAVFESVAELRENLDSTPLSLS